MDRMIDPSCSKPDATQLGTRGEMSPTKVIRRSEDTVVRPSDVLCGREKASIHHVGNNNFRDVVSKAMPVYGSYDLSDKSQLVDAIITEIKDAGGRFLKKHSATGKWYELEDGQVREKVRYAVRDRNNKLKNRESKPRKKKQKTRRPKQPPIASLSLVSASMVCPKSSLVSGGESSHSGYVDSNPTLGTQRGTSDIYCTSLPITVRPADVLCGKQKESINHVGTRQFQVLVSKSVPKYSCSHDKSQLVNRIFTEVINGGGRFLKKDQVTGNWYELDDYRAKVKVRYAVRDRNNKLKKKPKPANAEVQAPHKEPPAKSFARSSHRREGQVHGINEGGGNISEGNQERHGNGCGKDPLFLAHIESVLGPSSTDAAADPRYDSITDKWLL